MYKPLIVHLPLLLVLGCAADSPEPADPVQPALVTAAETGDLAALNQLLGTDSPVDTRDKCEWTPLMKAALNGHIRVVMRLLAAGAEVDAVDSGGYTALLLAASNDHPGIVNLLALHGADIQYAEPGQGWTALIWAAKRGHEGSVRVLLRLGADGAVRDKSGKRAIDWAEAGGYTEIVAFLRG